MQSIPPLTSHWKNIISPRITISSIIIFIAFLKQFMIPFILRGLRKLALWPKYICKMGLQGGGGDWAKEYTLLSCWWWTNLPKQKAFVLIPSWPTYNWLTSCSGTCARIEGGVLCTFQNMSEDQRPSTLISHGGKLAEAAVVAVSIRKLFPANSLESRPLLKHASRC